MALNACADSGIRPLACDSVTVHVAVSALAWSGRMVVDTVALYAMTARLEPRLLSTALRDLVLVVGACLGAVVLARSFP